MCSGGNVPLHSWGLPHTHDYILDYSIKTYSWGIYMQGYNAKLKKFNNGEAQIIFYSKPIFCKTDYEMMLDEVKNDTNNNFSKSTHDIVERALTDEEKMETALKGGKRAKKKISDYARSNKWDWFTTFTFNDRCSDRYNYNECSKKIRKWLNNIRNRYAQNLKYLAVPEQHKDGAWHFHILLSNCGNISFLQAINPKTDLPIKTKKGQPVFNIDNWNYGFSTATRVTDTKGVAKYILKYITKTLCESTIGQQRYFISNNLDIPEVIKMCIDTFGTTDDVIVLLSQLGLADYYVSNFKDVSSDYLDVRYIELVSSSS